jgi:DNA-binding protein H-NS
MRLCSDFPITKEAEMKTYSQIQAEIAKLEKQANAARKGEVAGVVKKIKDAIAAYGLTAQDLGFSGKAAATAPSKRAAKASKNGKPTTVGVAKYRDPATGKTWTGRGKPPDWIKGAKNRDQFLIGAADS